MDDRNYKRIALCEDFNELYKVIKEIGNIQGSHNIYTSKKSIESIEIIRSGGLLNYITRTYGLRAKVAELIWYEKEGVL